MKVSDRTMSARFNMLELLLVILILAVLAGIFFPHTCRPREKARRVNCAGNLKQIGLATLMYSGDFDGYFLQGGEYGSTDWDPLVVEGYIQNGKVWACPSAVTVLTTGAHSAYRYIGSGLKDDNATASSASLAYDVFDNHPNNEWMNLLFIDGHVTGGKPGTAIEPYQNEPEILIDND